MVRMRIIVIVIIPIIIHSILVLLDLIPRLNQGSKGYRGHGCEVFDVLWGEDPWGLTVFVICMDDDGWDLELFLFGNEGVGEVVLSEGLWWRYRGV